MKPNQPTSKKISIFKDFDFAQIERTKILLQAHKLQQQTKDEILQDITNFPKKFGLKAYTQVSDDEVIVNFMDFETCFNDEYFAVPLELGIVQCAVKFDVVDSKIKFLHIRILDYLHCFFDPDVHPSLRLNPDQNRATIRIAKQLHGLEYYHNESVESLVKKFKVVLDFLGFEKDGDEKRILCFAHNPTLEQQAMAFLKRNMKILADSDDQSLIENIKFHPAANNIDIKVEDISMLLIVADNDPKFASRDHLEEISNKLLPDRKSYPYLFNRFAQCEYHQDFLDIRNYHCGLEDCSTMYVLLRGLILSKFDLENVKILFSGKLRSAPRDDKMLLWDFLGKIEPEKVEVVEEEMAPAGDTQGSATDLDVWLSPQDTSFFFQNQNQNPKQEQSQTITLTAAQN